MGYGRTNSGGGATLPLNTKKVEMYGNTDGAVDYKNSLAILTGSVKDNIYTLSTKDTVRRLKTETQEEGLYYAGNVIELIWNPEKNKGFMIRNGNNNETWYGTIFSMNFNPDSVVDSEQFKVTYLKNALISNNAITPYAYRDVNLFKINDSKYLLLFAASNSNGLYYLRTIFINIDWDNDTITLGELQTLYSGTNDSSIRFFDAYFIEELNKIVLCSIKGISPATSASSSSNSIVYAVISFNSTDETCTLEKKFTTLISRGYSNMFKFMRLSSRKFGIFARNSANNGWTLSVFTYNPEDNSMTAGSEQVVTLKTDSAKSEANGVTLEYNEESGYSVIMVGARYSMHEYDTIYRFSVSDETLTEIGKYQNVFTNYMGTKRLRGADYGNPKGVVDFIGFDSSYSENGWYGKQKFDDDYLSYKTDGVSGKVAPGSVFGQVIFYDEDFRIFIGRAETDNFTQGMITYRRGHYIYSNTSASISSKSGGPVAASLIMEDMTKWKKGKATVPENWIV